MRLPLIPSSFDLINTPSAPFSPGLVFIAKEGARSWDGEAGWEAGREQSWVSWRPCRTPGARQDVTDQVVGLAAGTVSGKQHPLSCSACHPS